MPRNLKYSTALKNAQQNAITSTVGANALLRIYSGSQPASPDAAITSQVLLVELACSATFAAAAAGGVLTVNAISQGLGTAGAGAGTNATWFRLVASGGTSHIDGTVGVVGSTSDLELNNVNIAQNQPVNITSFTITNQN